MNELLKQLPLFINNESENQTKKHEEIPLKVVNKEDVTQEKNDVQYGYDSEIDFKVY